MRVPHPHLEHLVHRRTEASKARPHGAQRLRKLLMRYPLALHLWRRLLPKIPGRLALSLQCSFIEGSLSPSQARESQPRPVVAVAAAVSQRVWASWCRGWARTLHITIMISPCARAIACRPWWLQAVSSWFAARGFAGNSQAMDV